MKNTFVPFGKNLSKVKKFWIRREIDRNGRTIESGSFNEELYQKYKQAIKPI